ncbi:hypothetical protein ABW20_dc0108060 [Dactylellina cionopaga]|nr:hypothetical protein ABW20_dc0108060 [Dactylellina cionopaga]
MVFGDCVPVKTTENGESGAVPPLKGDGGVASAAERVRQREIASYLNAASIDLTTPNFNPDAGLPARVSIDPSLTALVQLGALRLDCDRSFLSLIDGTTQYIIAEATRSTSLTNFDATPEESGLYLGVIHLDVAWGVCPNTMKVFTDDTGSMDTTQGNIIADKTRYIINDFWEDSHYITRPYVAGWPHMRSYAEVPIISPLGYVIGGYCVVDNKLRDFGDQAISALTEIASTIMAHLENVRVRQNQLRSERLIRGLDVFIQEEIAIRESRLIPNSSTRSRNTSTTHPSKYSSSKSHSITSETVSSSSLSTGPVSSVLQKPSQQPLGSVPDSAGGARLSTDSLVEPCDMKRAFKRSALLIREAIGMDGLVFLDACPVGFVSRNPESNVFDRNPFKSSQQDDLFEFLPSTKPTPVLASSLSEGQSNPLMIPEGLLYRMIRRYKQGQVFIADEHGPLEKRLSPPTEQGNSVATSPGISRRDSTTSSDDTTELFGYLPQARSIIFLPLWHFHKEKWFAVVIGWTSDVKKSFDPSDSTYLNAFGNAIMAEILRLETLAVSKAKSDFISSISHELRSPLHGILGTAELLAELLKSPEEINLLHMLRSCGITLLDTMNHLLDYAKINSLSINKDSKRRRSRSKKGMLKGEELIDLSELVEDVVESVQVGYSHEHGNRSPMKPDTPTSLETPDLIDLERDIPVLVTIDIAASQNWNLRINTGAWRRIVMNLFGNSLKYTPSGRIEVKLDIVQLPANEQKHILFRVKDTGIGMDKDYQKYKLFQPFAQENSLSNGTGLGLCIVQQIVQQLGGEIEIQSERGVGTMIAVSVPLLAQKPSTSKQKETRPFTSSLQRLRGLKLGYITPETSQLNEGELFGAAKAVQGYHQALQLSVTKIANDWAGMNVVPGRHFDQVKADIYVIDDSIPSEDLSNTITSFHPHVVISGTASSKEVGVFTVKLP